MSSHFLGKICRIRHTQWLPTQEMEGLGLWSFYE